MSEDEASQPVKKACYSTIGGHGHISNPFLAGKETPIWNNESEAC